jgi:hypothetical protein
MRASYAVSLAAVVGLCSLGASADVIYSPTVEEGEKAVEWRSTVNAGGSEEHKLELEASPTAWWKAAVLATVDRDPGAARQVGELSFENIFSLNPQGRDFLDLGILAELSRKLRDGRAFEAEIGLLAEHSTARTVTTVNLAAERELLAGADTELTFAARWRYRLGAKFEPGVEYHANLGTLDHLGSPRQQRHSIGPSVLGKFPIGRETLRYEAAWVYGLTEGSPAGTFRLQLEWEFH